MTNLLRFLETPKNRQPNGNNYFIQYGHRLYLVSPESCRPAAGYENWIPDQAAIDALKTAEGCLKRRDAVDLSQDPPPDESEAREPEVVLDPVFGFPDVRFSGFRIVPNFPIFDFSVSRFS